MGYKTISLAEEAYRRLAAAKREGESFTDVVLRLCSAMGREPLASFAGSWVMSDEEEKEIFGEIMEMWKKYEEGLLGHRLHSSVVEKPSRGSREG